MPPSRSAYSGKKPFETTKLSYGTQVLWPDHCVQGTDDAALHKDLKLPTAQLIIRKGFHKDIDSYSAFEEADRKTAHGPGRLPEGARHRRRSSSPAWPPTSASPGPRWTRARPASRPT